MVRKFLEDIFRRKLDVLHSAKVVHTLYQQQKQGKYCDLKVLVEDRQYFVHRCVLASASAQLDAQINGLDTIQLVGVTNYGFECLLEILYSGKLSKVAIVDSTRFHQIISAADALNAESVIEYCARERSDLMKLVIDQADHSAQSARDDITPATPTTTGLSEMSVSESMAVDSPVTDIENVPSTSDPISDDASSVDPAHSIVPEVFANNPQVKIEPDNPESADEISGGIGWDKGQSKENNLHLDERVAAEVEVADGSKINDSNLHSEMKLSPNDQDVLMQSESVKTPHAAPVYSSVTNIHAIEPESEDVGVKPRSSVASGALSQTIDRLQSNRMSLMSGVSSMYRGVKCTICKRMFSTSHHLKVHMKKHASGAKPFRCEMCGMRFSFQLTLSNHMKLHDLKKYLCKVCGKDFKLNKNLHAHMQHAHPEEAHLGLTESPYSFPKSFAAVEGSSSRRKTVPVKLAVGDQDVEESEPDEMYSPEKPGGHDSNWVAKISPSMELDDLKKAVESVQVGQDGKYECPLCNKGFSRRWNLKCHVLTHSENHQSRRQAMKMPVRKEPPKPHMSPFQCPDCGKGFGNMGNLRKHATVLHPFSQAVETVYASGMPYVKPSKSSSASGGHSQMSAQQTCWCDICGRGFRRLRNLRSHMETHTGMGYECHICGRTFAQKDGLNGHLWVHGGMGGSKNNPNQQGNQGAWEQRPASSNSMT